MASIYSAFDLFCLPTRGEGFGMPVIEAQMCGTPVVVTDNTSGPELCKSGGLIPTDADDLVYTGLNTWRKQPKPSRVEAAIIAMHSVREKVIPEDIVERVSEYHWDNVWMNHWQAIIQEIEGMLPLEEPAIQESERPRLERKLDAVNAEMRQIIRRAAIPELKKLYQNNGYLGMALWSEEIQNAFESHEWAEMITGVFPEIVDSKATEAEEADEMMEVKGE